jgi:HflC protein
MPTKKRLPMASKSRTCGLNEPTCLNRMKKPCLHACKPSVSDKRSSIVPRARKKRRRFKSEAEKDREIILAEAYRESEELRGGGDAKAFRIYADAYRQDPHFFEFTRTMEAYRKTLKDKTTILVSPESEFFRYLKQR